MAKYCPVACKNYKEPAVNTKECKDLHPRCPIWKSMGECQENPSDMNRYCRKSCNKCAQDFDVDESLLCADKNETCAYWASLGECQANPSYMSLNCAKSCNTCEKTVAPKLKSKPSGNDEKKERLLEWSEAVGVRQSAIGADGEATLDKIERSKVYWEGEAIKALPVDLVAKCRNLHELCSFWAHLGTFSCCGY